MSIFIKELKRIANALEDCVDDGDYTKEELKGYWDAIVDLQTMQSKAERAIKFEGNNHD